MCANDTKNIRKTHTRRVFYRRIGIDVAGYETRRAAPNPLQVQHKNKMPWGAGTLFRCGTLLFGTWPFFGGTYIHRNSFLPTPPVESRARVRARALLESQVNKESNFVCNRRVKRVAATHSLGCWMEHRERSCRRHQIWRCKLRATHAVPSQSVPCPERAISRRSCVGPRRPTDEFPP